MSLKTEDVIFIVGAGRSGTTWLHLMTGAHPDVATGQESQLFQNYLRKLDEQWQRELRYPETDDLRKHGITSYIDQQSFDGLLQNFALTVFANVLAAKRGASRFLEKSPNNSFNVDLIHRCFPDAYYVHMIRDGRDVATSMLAAKKGWGRQWAPTHAYDAAAEWTEAVSESRRLRDKTERYIEVRYEELLSDGVSCLADMYRFLGLAADDAQIQDTYERFSFRKLQQNDYQRDVFLNPGEAKASGTDARPEPKGFFRKGIAGDWKNALDERQLEEVYWAAGDLLAELGYLNDWQRPDKPPAAITRRQRLAAVRGGLKRAGKRLLG